MNKPMPIALVLTLSVLAISAYAQKPIQTENLIFLMTDGLRWQEVFTGADETLMSKESGGVRDRMLRTKYWRDTPEERRAALMPFLWGVIARDGQIFGNPAKGSVAEVANGLNFSYPGYSETLCGVVDPGVDSNNRRMNPNLNVLEWLNGMRRFNGRVAAFGAWDLFPYILNRKRSGLFINAGYEPMPGKTSKTLALLNTLKDETIRYWPGEPFDSLAFQTALEYLKTEKPRVLFVSLGETDEWAHDGRYDLYLDSARYADACAKTLWETVQAMPRYRGKTTLILSTDHGRGSAPDEWKSHGKDIQGSQAIWMAFMGPGIPAQGERAQTQRVTAGQLAATLVALLGQDFSKTIPQAAPPINLK
jgi:hypothetical protein